MSNIGGPIRGISPKQTINNCRDNDSARTRRVLRDSWNTGYATGISNGRSRAIGEFKAVNNIGDLLSRTNYACGNIPNPNQPNNVTWRSRLGTIIKHCDTTGVPCSNTNTKFVPDSSDYITYKKQRAMNQTYNDSSFVGNQSNGSYVAILGSKRFIATM